MGGIVIVHPAGKVGDADVIRVERWRGIERDQRSCRMGAKLWRIDAIIAPLDDAIFFDLEEVEDRVRVKTSELTFKVDQVVVIGKGTLDVAVQFMAAQVIENFPFRAILVDHPGEELVEVVALQVGAGQQVLATGARFGENFAAHTQGVGGVGRFVAVIKGAIAVARIVTLIVALAVIIIGVGLLITLQVVPLGEDQAAIGIDDRRKITGRRMVEQPQVTGGRVKAPQPGDRGRQFVFIQLRVEMIGTVARAVTRKDDPVVTAIDRADVVKGGRLVGHFGDDRCRILP